MLFIVWINSLQDFASNVEHNELWVIFTPDLLVEWIIGTGERNAIQAC
jgi:hypothetical protein